jgi:hypothetical protein
MSCALAGRNVGNGGKVDAEAFVRWFERVLRKSCLAVGGGFYGAFVSIGVLVTVSTVAGGHAGEVAGLAGVAGFIAGGIGGAWGTKALPKRIVWAGGLAAVFGPIGGYFFLLLLIWSGAPL